MPRKTTGCWTCRARKKKCDDARPSCVSCTARHIVCYGYDAKPAWMDGADAEKDMLRAFKLQCKASYRQRRMAGSRVKSDHAVLGVEQAQSTFMSVSAWSPINSPASVPVSPSTQSESRFSYSERELNMVMYYLDHTFPRLCPFFVYTPSDNGRGWLLNLFLRTKPLCAVAVCLSACDQKQWVLGALKDAPTLNHDLELQHLQIVTDLRDHLGLLSEKRGVRRMSAAVEALACIMHLILFELWIPRKGQMDSDWVMHLDAASTLLQAVALRDSESACASAGSPMSTSSSTATAQVDDIAAHFPVAQLSDGEKSAFAYYLTQYTYVLSVAVATIGLTAPSALSAPRIKAVFHSRQSRVKDMLGCEDWVITTLLDIALLKDWKAAMQRAGTLSLRELARRADILEERLQCGLAALEAARSNHSHYSQSAREADQALVTSTFVTGALVFLHTVTSGLYPHLPKIQNAVARTLDALEQMRWGTRINIPSWPYCVAGCLALEGEFARFRALSPPHTTGTHPLVLTWWALDIVEECWRTRVAGELFREESCDWVTAMERLGTRLLLA